MTSQAPYNTDVQSMDTTDCPNVALSDSVVSSSTQQIDQNKVVLPEFAELFNIKQTVKIIIKMYKAVKREQNLTKNIQNYELYCARCKKCGLNARPIDVLINELEKLREKISISSNYINYIKF